MRTAVLVEGVSDQLAVETLGARLGRDLAGDGISVVPMGGVTNISAYLARFGSSGLDVRLAGLCDEREAGYFQRGLERAGFGAMLTPDDMARHRFFVCIRDLEDELIRALGVAATEEILAAEGDLASFRLFQRQPAQLGKTDGARLRRFMGTRSGRKARYAQVLVNALELDRVPTPLAQLMAAL